MMWHARADLDALRVREVVKNISEIDEIFPNISVSRSSGVGIFQYTIEKLFAKFEGYEKNISQRGSLWDEALRISGRCEPGRQLQLIRVIGTA
jgi:hypothetical protein